MWTVIEHKNHGCFAISDNLGCEISGITENHAKSLVDFLNKNHYSSEKFISEQKWDEILQNVANPYKQLRKGIVN